MTMYTAVILVILGLITAGWVVQLAGVASLQAGCEEYLNLQNNDVHSLATVLQGVQGVLTQAQALPQGAASIPQLLPAYGTALGGLLQASALLAKRSAATVFTLTPDTECSEHFRYQWVNTGLQLLPLLLAGIALCMRNGLAQARVAICTVLGVVSVLAMENANSFVLARHLVDDPMLQRGHVFFAGCFITITMNLLLIMVLGWDNTLSSTPNSKDYNGHMPALAA